MPSNPLQFSPEQKERIRYHLGYLNVSSAATIEFGIPVSRQTLFIVELAMSNLLNVGIPRVLAILCELDKIEAQMSQFRCSLIAEQVGTVKLRADAIDRLEHEYNRWSGRLADQFGVPRYLYSVRFDMPVYGKRRLGSIPITRS